MPGPHDLGGFSLWWWVYYYGLVFILGDESLAMLYKEAELEK